MSFINIIMAIRNALSPVKIETPQSKSVDGEISISITSSYSGSNQLRESVSEAEVDEVLSRYEFVFASEVATLKTADKWFCVDAQKRRLRDGSDKAFEWVLPFVPAEIALSEFIKPKLEHGPCMASSIAKEIRALIRERRKNKQPYSELLSALYAACIMDDFVNSLEFENVPGRGMTEYVDFRLLQELTIEYSIIGYQCIDALSKTDVKWLVEMFGEPAEHQSIDVYMSGIRQDAISRYCWGQLNQHNKSAVSARFTVKSIEEWMRELVSRNIGYHKEWQKRVIARKELNEKNNASIVAALAATKAPFVVADIETTGLDPACSEILEVAAILVDADGSVNSEMSVVVNIDNPVPDYISKLTGITQAEIDSRGRPLPVALMAFTEFVADRPIFFHNAPFDKSFIDRAVVSARLCFDNEVYDTLPIARKAWPSIGTYKLSNLAEHVGAKNPEHRALSDARAALAVLMAAREKLGER